MKSHIHFFLAVIALVGLGQTALPAQIKPGAEAFEPKLRLDLPLLDLPYLSSAIQARANFRAGVAASKPASTQIGDYFAIVESPSMFQVMGITTSFYNGMNYGIAKGWNKLVDPNKSKSARVWNRIGKEFSAAIAFAATTKVPFAGGWAHEEFHRNIWAQYEIGSYNEIWNFNLAPDALSYVSHLQDEDLIWLKANDPAGFVRMGSAGIEAHFLTNERLQTEDFLYNTNLPNIALYWADVLAPIDYVNRAYNTSTIDEHAEEYLDETDILKRDFTGNDFTAWVYDLFRPEELYTARGTHPTGIGIDRYRDYNDLNQEMLDYVEKMGNRQWLNLVSPFMVGIRSIKIGHHLHTNFALRHYLTSFGDDIQLELYINHSALKGQIVLHRYSNRNNWFPGLEVQLLDHEFGMGYNKALLLSGRVMGWMQPDDQLFTSSEAQLGGLLSAQIFYTNSSVFQPYLQLEGKSSGWVAGNPYLTDKFSARIGLSAFIGR